MAVYREFDENQGTVQLFYSGAEITPKMRWGDPNQLLKHLSKALELAYQKLRDAETTT